MTLPSMVTFVSATASSTSRVNCTSRLPSFSSRSFACQPRVARDVVGVPEWWRAPQVGRPDSAPRAARRGDEDTVSPLFHLMQYVLLWPWHCHVVLCSMANVYLLYAQPEALRPLQPL